jgi:aldose sugar dehydrogenase
LPLNSEGERKQTKKRLIIVLLIIAAIIITTIIMMLYFYLENTLIYKERSIIQIRDKNLKAELVVEGLSFPTSMDFVDNNNIILALEKDKGTVRLISGGILQKDPVLKVNVDTKGERGLLGIATMNDVLTKSLDSNSTFNKKGPAGKGKSSSSSMTVFLFLTEAKDDHNHENNTSLRNRIYSYSWNGEKLVNPTPMLDLPTEPGPYHQGGRLKIGPDNNVYAAIGDLTSPNSILQNFRDGTEPNDTSIILQINLNNGSASPDNGSSNSNSNSNSNSSSSSLYYPNGNYERKFQSSHYYYYAYGIRNSFGMDFDPVTGFLWDTENGEDKYDEINLVKPGFNSGWAQVMGPLYRSNNNKTENDLVKLPGSEYADPVFSWKEQIGVTDIEFLNSTRLGSTYTNNIFVGDINYGNLYYFEVNDNRTGLKLDFENNEKQRVLNDLVADNNREISEITFGTGFGRITDIETGPDGYLYVLTYEDGKIYKIMPRN